MDFPYRRLIVVLTLSAVTAATSAAQQRPQSLKRTAAVREKAAKLKPGDHISVVRMEAEEEFGSFTSSGKDDFTFYDVDLKKTVTLRYDEVKKLKEGYGGYNFAAHRHTDRTRALVVVTALVAVVLTVLVVALAKG